MFRPLHNLCQYGNWMAQFAIFRQSSNPKNNMRTQRLICNLTKSFTPSRSTTALLATAETDRFLCWGTRIRCNSISGWISVFGSNNTVNILPYRYWYVNMGRWGLKMYYYVFSLSAWVVVLIGARERQGTVLPHTP